MTHALLCREAEPAQTRDSRVSPNKVSSKFRVSEPGDAFEQEADHAASVVSSGDRLGGWSLSRVNFGELQRQPSPTSPQPNNYGEAAGKLAEAFLKTDAGKKIADAVSGSVGKIGDDPAAAIATTAVVGADAVGAIAGLAHTHGSLPAQIPAIPLDKIAPGLKVQITYEGPVDRPTKGMLTFTYTPGGGGKKRPAKSAEELERERRAGDVVKAREHTTYAPGSPQDLEQKQLDKAIQDYNMRHFGTLPGTGGTQLFPATPPSTPGPLTSAPQGSGTQPGQPELHLPTFESPFRPKPLTVLDKKLELKPITPSDAAKREEQPIVQRKAAGTEAQQGRRGPDELDTSSVQQVVGSGGHPLDHETRRYMENRFGYDFSRVRVHTDSAAAASAKALQARAYTVGGDIVFGSGRYSPQTHEGRRLLAHELTHVVQQSPDIAKKPASARPAPVQPAPVQVQRDVDQDTDDRGGWFPHPIEKAKKVIRNIRGYKLFRVLLGKDLITGEQVERSAMNVLQALLNLIPGGAGDEAFARIQESGALEKAFAWVNDQLDQLGLNWDYFKGLFDEAVNSVSVSDIGNIPAAIERIKGIFAPAFDKVMAFARAVINKVFELVVQVVMEKLGGAKVLEILRKVGDTFLTIIKDPVGFLKNLIAALVQGFNQFKDHILEHLKNGVVGWLFGAIESTGIKLPKRFDLQGILGLVLQVLGLTWDYFRKKLVGLLGEEAVVFLEGAFDFLIQLAKAKDLATAWKMILAKADQLIDTVLDSVKQWAITKIITTAIIKLATLFNPVGAIIQAIQTIYTTVNFFIEKAKQLAALVEAITNSIAAIAAGNLTKAADFVETSMAKTISPVLGFLADLIGLGGVGEQVRKIVEKVQEKVHGAIDKIIDWVVQKGKSFYEKGKAAAGKVLEWWRQRKELLIGEEEHSIYMEGTEDEPKLMIASVPGIPWSEFLEEKSKKATANDKKLIAGVKKKAEELEQRLPPSADEKAKSDNVEKKRKQFNEIADLIVKLGLHRDREAPASVINYKDVRTEDDGGTGMNASVLSPKHPPGSVPSDEPKIWTSLGSLIQTRHYVQGHLLNHNLGGEGRRFNLTPINKKANSEHLHKIEKTVKKTVNTDKKVMSYKLDVVYGTHNEPKRLKELKKLQEDGKLQGPQEQELHMYEAEQRLCTEFNYETYELAYSEDDKKWKPVDGTKDTGVVHHTLDP